MIKPMVAEPLAPGPIRQAVAWALSGGDRVVVVVASQAQFMPTFDRLRRCIGGSGIVFVRRWLYGEAGQPCTPVGVSFTVQGCVPSIYLMSESARPPDVAAGMLVYVDVTQPRYRDRFLECVAADYTIRNIFILAEASLGSVHG